MLIGSFYNFEDFMQVCLQYPDPRTLRIDPDVLDDARKFFKIKSRDELLTVIGTNEFKWINHYKITDHNRLAGVKIDSCLFCLCNTEGYLAFFKHRDKWTIKSFHDNNFVLGDCSKSIQMKATLSVLKSKGLFFGGQNG